MQIKRIDANQVFVDIGFKANPAKWDDAKIVNKLNRLPDLVERTPDIPESIKNDPEHLVNRICKAVKENNEKIELEEDTSMTPKKEKKEKKKVRVFSSIEEYETGVPKKKDKKVKVKKEKENTAKDKERPVTKEKKEKVKKETGQGKDSLGFRIGSQAAEINKFLSNKPVDRKTLVEKTGYCMRRIIQHTVWLEKLGKAKITEKGISLLK